MKRLLTIIFGILLPVASTFAASYRYAVIPVEFSDVSFTHTEQEIAQTVNTARQYFDSQFAPSRTFVFDLLPVIKLPYPMSRYGANSSSAKDAALDEALRVACIQSRADFSQYDNDGDGLIDNICIITAGESESEGGGASAIWPQHLYLHDRGGTLGLSGKNADSFSVCSESSPIGIFCHEFAHSLGLMDMYDTDGRLSGGTSKGLWSKLSLMDDGRGLPNFCAIELEQLGLGTPLTLKEGSFRLSPLSQKKEYLRIDADRSGEYFLLECRDKQGWDKDLDGQGLVIYHIDRSLGDGWYSDMYRRNLSARERWTLNQVNCRPEHQCARVVEAVPGTEDIAQIFFPQSDHTSFGSETDPPFRFWSGTTSSLAISGITLLDDGSVTFNIITPLTITDLSIIQNTAIISWTLPAGLQLKECLVSWHSPDGAAGYMSVNPKESGVYSAIIQGLVPQTDYQATVRVVCTDGAIYSRLVEFRTKMMIHGSHPFIYLNSLERNEDGSFLAGGMLPLHIYNAQDAQKVEWYFNGVRIYPGDNGYWELTASGTLRAEMWLSDGSKTIITKQLTVR